MLESSQGSESTYVGQTRILEGEVTQLAELGRRCWEERSAGGVAAWLVELPGLEDVGEPGFIAFHGDDLVHDAGLHEPELHRVVDDDIHVSKLQPLVGRAVCIVRRVLAGGDVHLRVGDCFNLELLAGRRVDERDRPAPRQRVRELSSISRLSWLSARRCAGTETARENLTHTQR
jgi:hypothetical protein